MSLPHDSTQLNVLLGPLDILCSIYHIDTKASNVGTHNLSFMTYQCAVTFAFDFPKAVDRCQFRVLWNHGRGSRDLEELLPIHWPGNTSFWKLRATDFKWAMHHFAEMVLIPTYPFWSVLISSNSLTFSNMLYNCQCENIVWHGTVNSATRFCGDLDGDHLTDRPRPARCGSRKCASALLLLPLICTYILWKYCDYWN